MVRYSNKGLLQRKLPKVTQVRYRYKNNSFNLLSTLEMIAKLEGDIEVYDMVLGENITVKADDE